MFCLAGAKTGYRSPFLFYFFLCFNNNMSTNNLLFFLVIFIHFLFSTRPPPISLASSLNILLSIVCHIIFIILPLRCHLDEIYRKRKFEMKPFISGVYPNIIYARINLADIWRTLNCSRYLIIRTNVRVRA